MHNTKKTPSSGGPKLRYPKGSGKLSGRFVSAEILESYLGELAQRQKAQQRQQSRAKKLAHDRAVRKTQRERRAKLMAKTDGRTPNSVIQQKFAGWGSTATGKLREKTIYKWYGVYRVEGSHKDLARIANDIGSEARLRKVKGFDSRYELIYTPYLMGGTPSRIEEALPNGQTRLQDAAAAKHAQLAHGGGTVTYLGAFYATKGKKA